MKRLTQLHRRIVPGASTMKADSGSDTDRVAGIRAAHRDLVVLNTTAIIVHGQQDDHTAELLAQTYGNLLSPSDIAAMRPAGPGEFITIFGTKAHQRGGPATDQDDPPCMWPTSAAEEE